MAEKPHPAWYAAGLALIAAGLFSCTSVEVAKTTPTATTQPTVFRPTPLAAIESADLDLPYVILALAMEPGLVVRLDPALDRLDPVSPVEVTATAFDVSTRTGQMALGTVDGRILLASPGEEWKIILNVREDTEAPLYIRDLAWSPEGERLAYCVDLNLNGSDESVGLAVKTGVWIWNSRDDSSEQLLQNTNFSEVEDVNQLRVFANPVWSSDGSGLLLTAYYWEWQNTLWLDPISPDLDGSSLVNPLEGDWVDASWTRDAQAVLVSGKAFSSTGGLYSIDRTTLEPALWLDGDAEGMYPFEAYDLPAGVAFIDAYDPSHPKLHLGAPSQSGFTYELVGEGQTLCENPGWISLSWDPEGRYAFLTCNQEWRILSLDGSIEIDLTALLKTWAPSGPIELHWGPRIED